MPSRHRGSSLSDALTLERSEEGALVISSINKSDPTDQGLREGDEILGATINFNDLSKEEVLQVLKLMAPFDDKLHMVTRSSRSRSRSLDNLDQFAKTPKTMLKDSYSKLYNAKIKKFMKNSLLGEKTSLEGNVTAPPAPPAPPAKVNLRQDSDLPRLGVDFGLLKSKTLSTDHKTDAQLGDAGHLSYGRNMNLPPLGVGSNGTALFGAQVPSLRVDTKSPQLDAPDFHLPGTVPVEPAVDTTASVQLADSPSVDFAMPNHDRPPFGLNGNLDAPDVGLDSKGHEIKTPDVDAPDVKLRLKSSKRLKTPDLNVDNPESYADYPKFRLSGKSPDIDLDMPDVPGISMSSREENANIDLKSPDLDMCVPSGEIALPKFGMKQSEAHVDPPDQRLNTPKIKGEIHGPGLGLPKAELKGPGLAADSMSVDIKGKAGKYKAPKFRMPKFDLPKIPDVGLDGDVVEPGMQLTAPDLKAPKLDLHTQNVDLNMPSVKNKPQKFSLFGTLQSRKAVDISAGMKTPELTLKSPKIDGSVPDLTAPNMDLKTPKLDINAPNVNVGSSKGKFKIPKLKIPKFRRPNLKGPEFSGSLDGLDMDVNPANVNLQGSKPDVELPDVDYTDTFGKFQVPNMNLSDVKLSGLECDGPNLDLKSPDLDISGPKPSGRSKTPDINMPKVDLGSPILDLNAPKLNMDMPSGKLDMPDLHAPDWDVKAPSGKLKLPKFDLSGHLPKGPKLDLNSDLRSPDLSLNTPEMKAGIGSPDMDLSKIDLKAPKLDVNAPNLNIGSPKTRLKMPKIRIPEFGLPGLKGPEFDGSLNGPDVNLNAPNVHLRGSKPDLDIPDADVSGSWGKFKMPNMDLPDVDLSGPKFDGPDLDLKSPDLDMPNIDLKSPNLDLKAPKLNMDMPSGKLDMPDLHAPDWDVKAPSGKLKLPKFNLSGTLPKGPKLDFKSDLKSPDWSLNAPKITGGIKAPDMDSPKLNIGSPKTKLKMPKIKMPKLRRSSLKGPEIDGGLNGPDMNLNAPNVHFKGSKPDLDIPDADVSGSWGKFKMPNMNMPDVELFGPKFDGPDLDLKSPDLHMPNIDLKSPKLDPNAPKLNMDMPSGKLDMPDLHAPDWDVKAPSSKLKLPKVDLSGHLPKGPKLDLNSDLRSPDLSLNTPEMKGGIGSPDMDLSKMNFKSPKLDVNVPNVNIGSPKTKLKMPKIKMPKLRRSSLKGPEIDGSLNGPDINLNAPNVHFKGSKPDLDIPDADVSGSWGKFKMPNMNMPDVELFGPKFDGPDFDLKSPDLDMPNIDLKSPNLDLNAPKLNMDMPSGKLDMPDLHAPDWDVKAPSSKLKLPKFDLSGTLPKGPKLDLNTDLKSPDLSLKASKIKGGINAPDFDVDLKSPKLDTDFPAAKIGSPKGKLKMPKLKMPKFSFPTLKGPAIDGNLHGGVDLNAPTAKLNAPKADLDIDVSGPSGKLRKPHFDMPGFGLSGPKVNGPNLDLKSPNLDILGSPDWDVKAPSGKLKFPKFNMSGTLPKGANKTIGADLNSPDLNLKAPRIKGGFDAPDLNLPNMDLRAPKLEKNTPNVNMRVPKLKMPTVNLPNLKGPEIDGKFEDPEFGMNAPKVNLRGSKPGFQMPDFDIGSPSGNLKKPNFSMKTPDLNLPTVKGGIDAPTLDFPNMALKAPKVDMNTPDFNTGFPNAKIKKPIIKKPKGPRLDINGGLQSPDLSIPKVDFNGKKGTLKMPDLKAPHVSLSAPNATMPETYLSGPKVKGPGMNLTAPRVKGGARGPEFGLNVPSGNTLGPQSDFDSTDRRFKLPSLKLPQFGGPDLNKTWSDIDFTASPRSPKLDISPPNAMLNMKPPQLKGKVTGPNVGAPNTDLSMPKVVMQSPTLHHKNPDLNIDDLSLKFKPYKNRRSDNAGGTMKMPDLDIDGDVRFLPTERQSSRTRVRSSYSQADLGSVDFRRSDLNVDDFTGKNHVLRARGSKMELQASGNGGQVISPSGINSDVADPRQMKGAPTTDFDLYAKVQKKKDPVPVTRSTQDSRIRPSEGTDGYYVTVFPSHTQNQKKPNQKYNTLGGTGFKKSANMDLEVPGENENLKGSTFFLSNLV